MEIGKSIEIPFGAKDSELKGWEYTIPEGYEARIEGNKVILESKESEDERIRKALLNAFQESEDSLYMVLTPHRRESFIAWLEKQGQHKPVISDEAIREGVAHFGITQYQISNWLKKYIDIERQGSQNIANSTNTCKDEQNPAWSEEDEKNIEKLDGFLTEVFCYGHVYVSQKDKEELQSWLNSLKERYT